jgi:hypothetical protein
MQCLFTEVNLLILLPQFKVQDFSVSIYSPTSRNQINCEQQNPIWINQGQSMRIIVISHSTKHHSRLLKGGDSNRKQKAHIIMEDVLFHYY